MSLSELIKELHCAESILKPQRSINLGKGLAGSSKFKPKGKNFKEGKPHKGHKKRGCKRQKKSGGEPIGKCFGCGDNVIEYLGFE